MNCENCGAAMTLFPDRGYFYCEFCGSFHFPSASPDGVRLVGQAPERMECPACRHLLHAATLDDRFTGYQCPNCRGVLLDRMAFRHVLGTRRARAVSPAAAPQMLNRADLDRQAVCPCCRNLMQTHPYYGPGNIVIDTCDRCNLIWLDHGEIARAVDAPGRDRGADHRPPPRRPLTALPDDEKDSKRRNRLDLTDLIDALFD